MGVYWAIGVRSFRRFSTYRIATASGAFTNTVFGFILCGIYLTLWHERPGLGGYDVSDALTFVWLQQGLLHADRDLRRDHHGRAGRAGPQR